MSAPAVTLFGRQGCHLCELMIEELEPLCRSAGVTLRVLDVDADAAWRSRYGTRVPVLCAGEQELSGWPLDRGRVIDWLRNQSPDRGGGAG